MSDHVNTKKFRANTLFLIIGLALAAHANAAALLGPVVQISTPDSFAACDSYYGFLPAPDAAVEPMLAVNPVNPANIVAVWCGHGMCGLASSTTLDGGSTWLNQSLPFNGCGHGADPWVSFGPSGVACSLSPVSRSTDGGQSWTSQDIGPGGDKPSITCDRFNPNVVYVAWAFINSSFGPLNNCSIWIQRSVDGGQTWLVP